MEKSNSTVARRKFIMSEISKAGQVYVHQLSEQFKVSEVTIRNDLEQLERKKILIRARGGAIKYDGTMGNDQFLSDKDKIHYEEKMRIGKKAASLINDKDTIILDSGTTTMEIARNLPEHKDLTVITNALNIVNQLANRPELNLIMLGGYLRRTSLSLVGFLAEKNLQNFYVDKVFLGVDGFDTKQGAYTPNLEEAHLNQIMIQNAKEVILVTDSSKFFRKSLALICGLNMINTIVTDEGISKEDRSRLEDAGIKLLIS
jgi:DeoR family transcriptional regulator, aga operon transcriptional repressor